MKTRPHEHSPEAFGSRSSVALEVSMLSILRMNRVPAVGTRRRKVGHVLTGVRLWWGSAAVMQKEERVERDG
jgi:hypothetical protein